MKRIIPIFLVTIFLAASAWAQPYPVPPFAINQGLIGGGDGSGGIADPNGSLAALAGVTISASGDDITFPGKITSTAADGQRAIIVPFNTTSYTCPASYVGLMGIGTTAYLCINGAAYVAGTALIQEVDGHTDATNLTAAQQERTTIHNVGQGANAVTLNLFTLVNGMAFTLDVGEAQTSHRWRIKAQSGQYIYLLGSDGTTVTKGGSGGYIGVTSPAVGNCLSCKSFKDGASSVGLQCVVISGTWSQE